MAVYTQVSAEALGALLDRYDVGTLVSAKGIAEGVENSNYLVETDRSRFILTLYEKRVDAGDLPFFLALLDHLAAAGLPVPPAIADREGEKIQTVEERPACLIKFLPGVSLSVPTRAQARAAAYEMARMHDALRTFPLQRPNSMGLETWTPLLERCGQSLNKIAPGLYDDLAFAIYEFGTAWDDEFDRSVIHADLFPDNVLMLGERVTGLIDFYFASTDVRIYDLAIMMAAWSFDHTGTIYDPSIEYALIEGYERVFPLSFRERGELYMFACGACTRFTLSRAWDWLNTPKDALVTRKDPLAFWRRIKAYDPDFASWSKTLR